MLRYDARFPYCLSFDEGNWEVSVRGVEVFVAQTESEAVAWIERAIREGAN